MISDSFQILGYHQKVHGLISHIRILVNHSDQLIFNGFKQIVHYIILNDNFMSLFYILIDKSLNTKDKYLKYNKIWD